VQAENILSSYFPTAVTNNFPLSLLTKRENHHQSDTKHLSGGENTTKPPGERAEASEALLKFHRDHHLDKVFFFTSPLVFPFL
jgi:hypothetical protein